MSDDAITYGTSLTREDEIDAALNQAAGICHVLTKMLEGLGDPGGMNAAWAAQGLIERAKELRAGYSTVD